MKERELKKEQRNGGKIANPVNQMKKRKKKTWKGEKGQNEEAVEEEGIG